jgi:hypothetical protein
MKFFVLFCIIIIVKASVLNFKERKAELMKDLNSNKDHHHSHSHSWERRRNRYWYAGRYRYRPYPSYRRYPPYNDYDYDYGGGRQYNQQPMQAPQQVFTTAPPFPFNLFG